MGPSGSVQGCTMAGRGNDLSNLFFGEVGVGLGLSTSPTMLPRRAVVVAGQCQWEVT